ncbi:MAG TPA: nucleotidyltransferase family protein [Candidatus Polarisedimenticolia bacterium]|nr:nucleotidyltransferase family protein [Candidatus Polarisedimenticolia bacterium]
MANPASDRQERGTAWTSTAPAGVLGMLAAPAVARDALLAALADLPASAVAPLLERLSYHRLDGLAFRAVDRLPHAAVDPWLRASLKRRYQRLTAATLVEGMAVAEILDSLGSRGIRVAVVGGLRSVESIYGDAGSRPIDSHDLLVLSADRETAAATLRRLGLQPAGGVRFRRGALLVDLHVDAPEARLRARRPVFPLPTAGLMERASHGRVAGAPAMLLSPEDELLLLAVDTVRRSFGRLIAVADLAHMVAAQGCAIDWTVLRARAAASHTSHLVGLALQSTALLGVAPPEEAKLSCSGRWPNRLLVRLIRSFRPLPPGGEILAALSAPGLIRGLRCLADVLLPAPRIGVAPRPHRSRQTQRDVVTVHPRSTPHRHLEESAHGR